MCNMKKIKPKKLNKGDTIGILAVSGRIKEYERIENAKRFFEKEGYNVIISDTCKTSHRYMAGKSDEDCINALHDFFADKSTDAILCARGGYGTIRLLNGIDWNLIKNNPKIFAGYSDITILLNMIYKKTGLITFHSAMANGDFGAEIEEYTKNSFFNALEGKTTFIKAENKKIFKDGNADGILWGGNLSTLCSLCGTDFVPDDDLILFLEDLNEPVYKIDKMLTQLFNCERVLKNVKGIAFGEFKDIDDNLMFDDMIGEFAEKLKIPVCSGFRLTHNKIKDTIPIGIQSTLKTNKGTIEFSEKIL